jgi:hypothetical protein
MLTEGVILEDELCVADNVVDVLSVDEAVNVMLRDVLDDTVPEMVFEIDVVEERLRETDRVALCEKDEETEGLAVGEIVREVLRDADSVVVALLDALHEYDTVVVFESDREGDGLVVVVGVDVTDGVLLAVDDVDAVVEDVLLTLDVGEDDADALLEVDKLELRLTVVLLDGDALPLSDGDSLLVGVALAVMLELLETERDAVPLVLSDAVADTEAVALLLALDERLLDHVNDALVLTETEADCEMLPLTDGDALMVGLALVEGLALCVADGVVD